MPKMNIQFKLIWMQHSKDPFKQAMTITGMMVDLLTVTKRNKCFHQFTSNFEAENQPYNGHNRKRLT